MSPPCFLKLYVLDKCRAKGFKRNVLRRNYVVLMVISILEYGYILLINKTISLCA